MFSFKNLSLFAKLEKHLDYIIDYSLGKYNKEINKEIIEHLLEIVDQRDDIGYIRKLLKKVDVSNTFLSKFIVKYKFENLKDCLSKTLPLFKIYPIIVKLSKYYNNLRFIKFILLFDLTVYFQAIVNLGDESAG